MLKKIIGFIIYLYHFSIKKVVYLYEEKQDSENDFIVGFFHQTLILWGIYATVKKKQHYTLISNHRDADLIIEATKKLPITCIRIDRRRPQKGFKEILKVSKNSPVGIAVDGPLGPIYEIHPGIVSIAKHVNKPIRIFFASSKKITFSSWDKFWFPIPFTKKYIYLSAPFSVNKNETIEKNLIELKKIVNLEKQKFSKKIKQSKK